MKRNTVESQSLHDVRRKACVAVEAAIQNHFLLKTTSKNQFNIMKKIALFQKNSHARAHSLSLRFLLLACLFGVIPAGWAREWTLDDTNGEFEVSSDKNFTSTVSVSGTLTLNIQSNVTFTHGFSTNPMFAITGNGKLVINGSNGKVVTFDGGCNVANIVQNGSNTEFSRCAIYMTGDNSDLELHYVKFTDFVSCRRAGGNYAGIISFFNGTHTFGGNVIFDNIEIWNCYAGLPNHTEPTGSDDNKWGRIINLQSGTWNITMTNSTIHHCYVNEPASSNANIYGMGGVIRSQGNVGGILDLNKCTFEDNKYYDRYTEGTPLAGQGGAINWRSGNNDALLRITSCRFVRNKAKQGGAIATNAKMEIVKGTGDEYTYISKNEAVQGGGIYFWTYNGQQATYNGQGFNAFFGTEEYGGTDYFVRVYDNYASQCGGGIYITIDPSNDVGFNPSNEAMDADFYVRLYKGARVFNNRSPLGAGVAIIDNAANKHKWGNNWSGVYNRTIIIDGGVIDDNKTLHLETHSDVTTVAGSGIYIDKRKSPNTGFGVDFTDATNGAGGTLTVNVISGTINNNYAKRGTFKYNSHYNDDEDSPFNDDETNQDTGLGGGFYIGNPLLKEEEIATSYLYVNVGEWGKILNVNNNKANTDGGGFCILGGVVTVTGATVTNNQALNGLGGGFYISVPNATETTTIRGGANISLNTAKGGGGVYVDKGEIDIIGSSWDANAGVLVPAETTRINNNTATDNDGGGVYLQEGKINIYGSDINDNEATKGNGGGIYTHFGDILVWPTAMKGDPDNVLFSICDKTKTEVLNNRAGGNGGGLDTHVGRFDVRFAQIKYNKAGYNYSAVGTNGGNGGGLFCEGPHTDPTGYTVRLIHCDLEENKAFGNVYEGEGITGRGGGVYLKFGSIFAEHCDIIKNEADINGGGLDNHSGELRVYGTYIDENVAKTGKGGGLYTEEGNIVVGPCDTYGYTASKASRIIKNKAKVNGGGINNHRGDITIHGDRINENEAETGDGGGVYINEGNIFMYGGQINENKADKGKGGGVYGGSGKFNIKERKANPIVEILEVEDIEDITNAGFTVHYHLVDRGKVPIKVTGEYPDFNYEDLNNLTHGVSYIKNGQAWADSSYVEYNSASHRYVLSEGCVRIPLTLSASQLYHVKAYAKYSHEEEDYFDASPVLLIATTGDKPVVATGEASEITQNSAKVTGKLFYKGDDDEGVVTQGIRYRIGEGEWTDVPSSDTEADFSVTLTGLDPGTTYQAQAYATNGEDIGYGDVTITFTTATGSKASQGPRSVYPAVEENPFFQALTPLQQAILASTPEGDTTAAPATRAKTGRDDPQAQPPEDIPEINENTAMFGGGICIDKMGAELIFSGRRGEVQEDDKLGQINENFASEAGGGIYIGYQTEGDNIGPAMMQMMGKCEVNKNRVPAGKHGGGIYLDGRFYVGDKDTDLIGTHGLKVDKNFAITKDQTTFVSELAVVLDDDTPPENPLVKEYNKAMNNIFLPRNDYDYQEHGDEAATSVFNKVSVLTLLSDVSGYSDAPTNKKPHSHIGFSVLNGFCPVIATADHFGGDYVIHNGWTGAPVNGSEEWLYNLMKMSGGGESGDQTVDALTGAVFEDSESYVAVHTRRDLAPFREKYIYLWGCWTHPIVKEDPERNTGLEAGLEEDDQSMVGTGKHYRITKGKDNILTWEIYSPEGLAWFSSYVNGLNVFDQKSGGDPKHEKWNAAINPYAKAIIMTDLDMSAYLWVPIGSVQKFYMTALTSETEGSLFVDSETQVKKKNPDDPTGPEIPDPDYTNNAHYYKGTFDGQGHIIKGLQGLYLTGIRKFGLFGYLAENAVVKNTFVDEGLFVSDDEEVIYSSGGIAGEMKTGSVVSNSEARSVFNITYSDIRTRIGGLVGEVKGGNIHSSMAMPEFYGVSRYVGGLVGLLGDGCDLFNSFSNPLFPEDSYDNNDTIWINCTLNELEEWVPGEVQNTVLYFGGLVGVNNGKVENCYSRLQGNEPKNSSNQSVFGWLAGTNKTNAIIKYGYAPRVANETSYNYATSFNYVKSNEGTLQYQENYGVTSLVSGKYGFKHRDQQMTTNTQNGNIINDVFLGGLLPTLNKWVTEANTQQTPTGGESGGGESGGSGSNEDPGGGSGGEGTTTEENPIVYSSWTRTMASPINDDYPILQISDFNSVGSKDGIYMLYEDDINDMWNPNEVSATTGIITKPGKNFQALNPTNYPNAAMYLYDVQPGETPADVTITDNAKAPLYIHEDVGITQNAGDKLTARTGVTIVEGANWHLFSSAISGVPMGIEYHGTVDYQESVTNAVWGDRKLFDPPKTTWSASNVLFNYGSEGSNNVGYFPTDTPYGTWRPGTTGGQYATDANVGGFFDLYDYSEVYYHWINYKRQSDDHWHWDKSAKDGKHYEIHGYDNDVAMPAGKGYLMALSSESMMMADGLLNNADYPVNLTKTPVGTNLPPGGHGSRHYDEPWRGINLIGNPYQSYLDFNRLSGSGKGEVPSVYAVIDESNPESSRRYVYYIKSQSRNDPYSATGLLHPHQGFFVKVDTPTTVSITNTMRVAGNESLNVPFRNEVNYPLVNLLCYDEDGNRDLTTVELNRPEFGGGHKMENLHESKGLIYAHLENESFQTLFTPKGVNVVPVRFVPNEDGVFTLNWNTRHGEFSYLHLIDNITGVDVDCLTTDEYKFEGKTSDYKSRFKLVFRCEGDEPEDPEEPDDPDDGEDSDHFAFMFGDELVVNGEGMLQMFDVQGRCLMETRAVGQQSSHRLPSVAAGVYVFRLTGDKKVKVQKMVIK